MNMRCDRAFLASVLAWLLLGSGSLAVSAEGAAVLILTNGSVNVRAVDGSSRPASFGLNLSSGDRVSTGPDSTAELLFASGQCVQIGENSSITIQDSPPERSEEQKSRDSSTFGAVESLLALRTSEGTSLLAAERSYPDPDDILIESLCQTRARQGRLRFAWQTKHVETPLRLAVYADSRVVWETVVQSQTHLDYPPDADRLKPGVLYTWTLETTDLRVVPTRRSRAGVFEVLAAEEEARVEASLEAIDGSDASPDGKRLLRTAMFYDAGLLDEAIVEAENAAAQSSTATGLGHVLARLYAKAGRPEAAAGAFDRLLGQP